MKPQVLLLQLGEKYEGDTFDNLYSGLCTKMGQHYTVIKANSVTTEHLAHSKAIIVTDGGLSKKKLQIRLSEYARNGGTLILACLFSSFVRRPDFDSMCRNMNLAWSWGDYLVRICESRSFVFVNERESQDMFWEQSKPLYSRRKSCNLFPRVEQTRYTDSNGPIAHRLCVESSFRASFWQRGFQGA